jgi:hypothetical protein
MIGLLTFIIAFNADFYSLQHRDRVEKIQMKFIIILQRYLRFVGNYLSKFRLYLLFRSRMSPEAANTKFIEAMMLISHICHFYWNIEK